MTHDEKWLQHYSEVMDYMRTKHRRPSKHRPEDLEMLNWVKHNKRMLSRGLMPPNRIDHFKALLQLAERYRRFNQYTVHVDDDAQEQQSSTVED